ncbi:hypothetical protein [Sphingomonas sp. RIT328]|uniref:hypothetical protein n=1 Tax=Sphingomonas sp. RIT328 TaxID=1470591 RepID=UPI000448B6CC|nr:hypothetical protein [Sphingomonas sp. RIT328]EZP50057.1 hypothetical protein BW41_03382 [Sphingomonas sp. RIT328]
MASQSVGRSRRALSVGGVFGRSFGIIKDNPIATLGVAFILMALPQLVLSQFAGRNWMLEKLQGGAYALFGVYGIIVGVLWLVASGALVQAAVAHDQGRRADLAETLQVGVRRFLPLFAVYLLFLLGVWAASILLLVPGIMLAVMWSVSLPVIVAERPGVFGAFGRSRHLTKGARWHVFGILLLALVFYMLASAMVGVVSVAGYGSFGAMTGGGQLRAMPAPSLFLQLLQSVVTTVSLTWFTLVGASLFIELRHWKDGPDVDRLTEIFA